MISYFRRTVKDDRLKRLKKPESGCWINVVNPEEDEINYLSEELGFDRENIISGLDPNEIPRIDFVNGDIYVFVKVILPNADGLGTFLIAVTDKYLLTLSRHEATCVKKILEYKVRFITTQKLKCLINLLSLINKEFEIATLNILKIVNTRKRMIKLKEKDVNILLEQEDILNQLVSSYYYMNLLYERMVNKINFFKEDKEILEDLIIEAQQGFNICKSSLKTISNIRSYYTILLSNKLNRIITLLTIFTIFISIPAAISGIYGMNVLLPLQKDPFAFWYILFIIFLIWMIFVVYLKKEDVI
ncbi:MAG: hypothetical protein DRP15_00175 [Candidatus Aenigmatarchaeota archaeon]|nr:MAG: hypothetical protein DRP15_00175 [Candidatus Aenigmarchaeota archaeon]